VLAKEGARRKELSSKLKVKGAGLKADGRS